MFKTILPIFIRFLICLGILFGLWLGGFVYFISQVPREVNQDTQATDAIVVLTGGKGRIDYGLKLLRNGKASRLFITGVESRLTPGKLVARHQPEMLDMLRDDENDTVIMLGYDARNTIGNAQETAQWLRREGFRSLRLVTANYHMPRALNEFQEVMPEVTIIPDPVLPEDFDIDRWWTLDASSQLLLKEYHKCIAAKFRHWLIHAVEDM